MSVGKNEAKLSHGKSIVNYIDLGYDHCNDPDLADTVKFNLQIAAGNQFGHLIDQTTGEKVTELNNLLSSEGYLEFEFTADGELPSSNEDVIIKITASDSRIQPVYITYHIIIGSTIQITFDPSVIAPWDSSSIHVKERRSNGEIVDFPPDQLFKISVVKGEDFGFLYAPGSTINQDGSQTISEDGLIFYAYETIEDTTIVKIYVETYVDDGNSSGRMQEQKAVGNKNIDTSGINRVTSKEKISCTGELLIVRTGARLHISFDKNPISPGDTARVIIKGVDNNNVPIIFPENQTYFLGLWNGWDYGELYSTSTGQQGEYIGEATEPFLFIAKDSINVDTALVDIDSLCIATGGKYGISPQVIKGQILTEATKLNGVFYPSYRYEPFSKIFNGTRKI